jgi:hypothetical protein
MAGMTDLAVGKITEAAPRGARGRLRVNFTINRQSPYSGRGMAGANLSGIALTGIR